MKILFVFDHQYEDLWKDGLWAALELIAKKHTVEKLNLKKDKFMANKAMKYDFILGWGAFHSPADNMLQLFQQTHPQTPPLGLCLAGNAFPYTGQKYDVLFYETEWTKRWLGDTAQGDLPPLVHAFGINSSIYIDHPWKETGTNRFIDYLTVGSFAAWKRQDKLLEKQGFRMAIGEIQKGNMAESLGLIGPLVADGVLVGDMITPNNLAHFYRAAKVVYIPASLEGGGERAVLEAQNCRAKVEIEDDNPKLKSLLRKQWADPIWEETYYAEKLMGGIEMVVDLRKGQKSTVYRNEKEKNWIDEIRKSFNENLHEKTEII